VHASPLPDPSYMSCSSHSSRFYHPHGSGWGMQIVKLLIYEVFCIPVTSSLLGPNILLNALFSNTLPRQRPSFTPIQNNRQNCCRFTSK
jgi:hypothetical protein